MENVSSEQELLELLREGKITEDEYSQLLEAMRKPRPSEPRKRFFRVGLAAVVIAAVAASVLAILMLGGPRNVDMAIGKDGLSIQPYRERGLHTFTVAIINRGRSTSPQFGVYFYRGDPCQVAPWTHSAGPIEPGGLWGERTLPFALDEGTNQITVVLDPDNLVVESEETNNRASLNVVVSKGEIVEKTPSYPGGSSEETQK
jgi:hypothetical protein